MARRGRNKFDVTNRLNATDHQQVSAEVQRIYHDLFQGRAILPALAFEVRSGSTAAIEKKIGSEQALSSHRQQYFAGVPGGFHQRVRLFGL